MKIRTQLTNTIDPLHLLKHPFYKAWTEGLLSREVLAHYAVQYYPHVEAFPRFISSIHGLCEDPKARKSLFLNLSEEEGDANHKSHPELWLDFAEGLGTSPSQVFSADKHPKALALVDSYFKLCRSSYAEGLGALIAYEMQVPEVAEVKIDGLKRFYGIQDKQTLAFFEVHKTADSIHSESCVRLLEALTQEEQKMALKAAETALEALWGFLSEVHQAA